MTMIKRQAQDALKTLAREYSVVMIEGPRQSGKTTLSKSVFPDKPYVLLEDPDTKTYAAKDPRGFLGQFPDGVILDEVQKTSDLVSYLQGIVDSSSKEKGKFILTGSQNLMLSGRIKQSLAGRAGILRLMPLSIKELGSRLNPIRSVVRRSIRSITQSVCAWQRCWRFITNGARLDCPA